MKNILEDIIAGKKAEVEAKKSVKPGFSDQDLHFGENIRSLLQKMENNSSSFISEFKRKSPSGFCLPEVHTLESVITNYEKAGASALSVLTDQYYFGGSVEDITTALRISSLPVLRKEFIIDEYQVFETKAIGANIILLIAKILAPEKTKQFAYLSKQLGMEVLIEVKTEIELEEHYTPFADFIGVNNRNLDTLVTDIETSFLLAEKIPDGKKKISESGIYSAEQVRKLQNAGYDGFLVGESLLRSQQPGEKLKELMKKGKVYEN